VEIKSYQLKLPENQPATQTRGLLVHEKRRQLPSACYSRSLFKPQAGDHFPPSPNEEPFLIDRVLL
jgi:hypothetical protein